jgi:hypothetical protein
MKYTINVTQDDIDHGERCSRKNCPIARAASRVSGLKSPGVMTRFLVLSPGQKGEAYGYLSLPNSAKEFISNFDGRKSVGVGPFSFEVDTEESSSCVGFKEAE